MANDALVSYTWATFADANKTRFRSNATGQFVSRATVQSFVESRVNSAEDRLGNLTRAYFDGRVSASSFQVTLRDELRRLGLQNASLGIGGWDRMTPVEFGRVGGLLRGDLARISNLALGVQQGTVTLPQALERVRGYIGNARINYYEAEKTAIHNRQMPYGMVAITIRDLGDADHCGDCLDYHAGGWAYDWPSPGTMCECHQHCRCHQRWRDVPTEDVGSWLGTRR